jgi:hypothetical protein
LFSSGLELPSALDGVLKPPLVLILSLGVAFNELKPPLLFCCVADGLLLGGFEPLGAFPRVLEPHLVLFLSLDATLAPYYCVGDNLHLMLLNLELWSFWWWLNH